MSPSIISSWSFASASCNAWISSSDIYIEKQQKYKYFTLMDQWIFFYFYFFIDLEHSFTQGTTSKVSNEGEINEMVRNECK